MKRIISTLALALASTGAFAQLPVGSVAPDFTLNDINGQPQHLYAYLDSGYSVIIDVSAAWCGPCWSAHQSHVFENLTDHYGKTGTIAPGKIKVLFIEGESTNTTAQLHGPATTAGGYAGATQGDWVTGTNYPIIDNSSQNATYLYGGYPSFTVICRDHLVGLSTAGYGSTMGAESWWLNYTNACPSYAPSTGVDAKAVAYSGADYFVCNAAPVVKFQNYSATQNITSATINIKSGSTIVKTQTWTGNLAPLAVASVSIAAFTPTQFAPYKYEVVVGGDTYPANNVTADSAFKVYASGNAITTPWSENFESSGDLPYRMSTNDEANIFPFQTNGGTLTLKGVTGATTRGICIAYPAMTSGNSADLIVGNFNTATVTNVALDFDVAYAQSTSNNDKLEVKVSKDCGATWATAWTKSGAALATSAPVSTGTAAFVPTTGSQWRHESALLSAYKNSNMLVKFTATAASGNYGWLDNLKITNTLNVANVISNGSVNLYPNPAKGDATLEFTLNKSGIVVVNVLDAVGRTVAAVANATMAQGAQHFTVPTATLAAGVYNVTIQTEEGTLTQRLSVAK